MKTIGSLSFLLLFLCGIGSTAISAQTTLYYDGDWDNVDGLVHGRGFAGPINAMVYEDFTVPSGQVWTLTSAFSNCLITTAASVTAADYEIRSGVSQGVSGTLLFSGTNVAVTVVATGRSGFGYNEYTVTATFSSAAVLNAGTYFIGVRPVTTSGAGNCFMSTTSGANGVGAPLNNDNAYINDTAGQFGLPAFDHAGNGSGTFYDFSTGVRGTSATAGPSVTINQAGGQADPTSTSPILFTVVFSEAVTGFATGDVTLSGTAGGTLVGAVTGGPTTYTVSVTGMTSSGTVVANISAGVCTSVATSQSNTASTSTDNSVTWNPPALTVTINQGGGQSDPTSASPIVFTAVFSEAVSGFATGDVTLSGTAGGTLVGAVSGGPITFTISVTGMTTSGNVIADIAAGVCTSTATAVSNAASTSTDKTVTWNPPPPAVTINQGGSQSDPASVSPIVFTAVFSEAVTGFATGDVTLGGTAGGTLVGTVSGGPTTYTVSVTGMTTGGTVVASIAAGVCTSTATGASNAASTTSDDTVTWTPVPVMDVTRGATAVADNGTDALGNVPAGIAQTVTYTITNNGLAGLNLTGGASLVVIGTLVNVTSATVTTPPAVTSLAPAAFTSFTITYTVTNPIAFSFDVSIANNDPGTNKNPYNWTASGTGATSPSMVVTRGATPVADGGTDSVGNATSGVTLTYTYTITNSGSATLTLTLPVSINIPTNCTATVTTPPAASIGAGLTSTMVISVTPTASGLFSFNVSIANDDPGISKNPYNWSVSGNSTTIGIGGGGGGGGGGGCTSDGTQGPWFAVFGLLTLMLTAIRLRRAQQ